MKNRIKHLVLIAGTVLVLTGSSVLAQPNGPTVTVKGEVVDLWCYLEGGDHGPSHKACATACAKAGNPIGVVDANGNVYVTAGIEDHQPAQAVLADKMSQEVTATGTRAKKGG